MKAEAVFNNLVDNLGMDSLEQVIQKFIDNLDTYETEVMFQSAMDDFPHLAESLEQYALDLFKERYGTEQGERLFYD